MLFYKISQYHFFTRFKSPTHRNYFRCTELLVNLTIVFHKLHLLEIMQSRCVTGSPFEDRTITADEEPSMDVVLNEINLQYRNQQAP